MLDVAIMELDDIEWGEEQTIANEWLLKNKIRHREKTVMSVE